MEQYRISYVYNYPSGAGPFKGKAIVTDKPAKGDVYFAPFGVATIKSVSRVNAAK